MAEPDAEIGEDGQHYPAALTVAGSDSGGGAGIQADLRTFAAFGVYGCSAITALTAQNPREVRGVFPVTADFVASQMRTVLELVDLRVVKTGMLFDAAIVRAVAEILRQVSPRLPLVVDPVMVSTSGHRLLDKAATLALGDELFPLAEWITPNIPEAEILLDTKINSFDDMLAAAAVAAKRWNANVVIKGGHLDGDGDFLDDAVCHGGKLYSLRSPKLSDTAASHGGGCTFSAAIAAQIALGFEWRDTLDAAKGFVYGSLREAVFIGEDVEAMYPPAENHAAKVSIKAVDNPR